MVGWVSCTLLPAPTGGLNSTDVQLEILPTTNLPQDRECGGEWWHPSGGLSHDLTCVLQWVYHRHHWDDRDLVHHAQEEVLQGGEG